ncbi:MAG: hypothetical protein ACR2K5_12750 [Pseudolabrys sp.]
MGQFREPPRQFPADPMAMAERLMEFAPATDTEALKLLRASFPQAPLSLRVAALAYLTRKKYPGRVLTPAE